MGAPEPLDISANGLSHRVWLWTSDGPPLLVVHGITNSGRGWDFVCRELQPEYRCYAVDLRGHGESEKPEHGYTTADYAADLAGIVEGLAIAPLRVIGHSLGARASARLAADRPDLVERLVLVDPPVQTRDRAGVQSTMDGFWAAVRGSRERGEAGVREQYPHFTDEQVARRLEAHRLLSDRVLLDPVERFEQGSIFDDLPRIACPTLFLYGDTAHTGPRPGIVSYEAANRAAAALRQGTLVNVPRTGHMVPWDDLAGFLAPVRSFLAR